jgi:hypothetical protein
MEDRLTAATSRLIELIGGSGRAVLAYAAVPPRGLRLDAFYADDGIRGTLRSLPDRALRPNGFGLGYGHYVRAVDDALVDVEEGRRGVLVAPEGTLVTAALAIPDFLGWADRGIPPNSLADRASVRLNPYVLAEYSLEFARFVRDIDGPTGLLGLDARCHRTAARERRSRAVPAHEFRRHGLRRPHRGR